MILFELYEVIISRDYILLDLQFININLYYLDLIINYVVLKYLRG